MVTVLGGLAEFERELILARTSDGRSHADLAHRIKLEHNATSDALMPYRSLMLTVPSLVVAEDSP